jgi:hypothetical protein
LGTAFLALIRLSTGDPWSDVVGKLGISAGHRPPHHMKKAKTALTAFNSALTDLEVKQAAQALEVALPGCIKESELHEMEDGISIDCSIPNHCDSTCGSPVAYFFVPFFVVLTNFVVLELVLTPLMIEIGATLNAYNTLPGTNKVEIMPFLLALCHLDLMVQFVETDDPYTSIICKNLTRAVH